MQHTKSTNLPNFTPPASLQNQLFHLVVYNALSTNSNECEQKLVKVDEETKALSDPLLPKPRENTKDAHQYFVKLYSDIEKRILQNSSFDGSDEKPEANHRGRLGVILEDGTTGYGFSSIGSKSWRTLFAVLILNRPPERFPIVHRIPFFYITRTWERKSNGRVAWMNSFFRKHPLQPQRPEGQTSVLDDIKYNICMGKHPRLYYSEVILGPDKEYWVLPENRTEDRRAKFWFISNPTRSSSIRPSDSGDLELLAALRVIYRQSPKEAPLSRVGQRFDCLKTTIRYKQLLVEQDGLSEPEEIERTFFDTFELVIGDDCISFTDIPEKLIQRGRFRIESESEPGCMFEFVDQARMMSARDPKVVRSASRSSSRHGGGLDGLESVHGSINNSEVDHAHGTEFDASHEIHTSSESESASVSESS